MVTLLEDPKSGSQSSTDKNMVVFHGFNSGMENGTNGHNQVLRNSD